MPQNADTSKVTPQPAPEWLPPGGTLLAGGRVVDPANGVDEVADVYLLDDSVAGVFREKTIGAWMPAVRLNVTGSVVAPGFVDLHSHLDDPDDALLQAFDGVTTALDLESGAADLAGLHAAMLSRGHPVNFGHSAAWALSRMSVTLSRPAAGAFAAFAEGQKDHRWQRPLRPGEDRGLLARLEKELADGAIGIGVLLGYAPGTAPEEYCAVAAMAAGAKVPLITHARSMSVRPRGGSLDAVAEIIAASRDFGTATHICHVNSTALRQVRQALELVAAARAQGLPVSTEAYPYGCASTVVGAPFLEPAALGDLGISLDDVRMADGSVFSSPRELTQRRRSQPGDLALFDWLDERAADDRRLLLEPFATEGVVVASDAMPRSRVLRGPASGGRFAHPRGAASFSRAFRLMVREERRWDLMEFVRRCSVLPAGLLASSCAAMRAKGHLGPGADADVVVFAPERFTDMATYERTVPSAGMEHVFVNGRQIVRFGEPVAGQRPGRAIHC
ncbi:amidohydrolase family protein, partial [Nonomuraea sp. RK-328]|nr:amidohydrolase family protein [Nonomuraea sp. RK-328]